MRISLMWALLLAVCLPAQASIEPVRLVTGDMHAPYTGRELPKGGMLTMIVRAALKRHDLDSSVDWRPWNRGYLMTLNGSYDGTFPYAQAAEREAEFLFSDPLLIVENHLFSLSADPLELDTPETLHGKRMCLPLGWRLPDELQGLRDSGALSVGTAPSLIECAKLLVLDRHDFFVATPELAEVAMRASGQPARFHRSRRSFGHTSLHLIVPRSHMHAQQLVRQFNEGLTQLQQTGEYDQLIARYMHLRHQQATTSTGHN